MSIPYFSARTASLPYREPGHLPNRPRYAVLSPSPNLQSRESSLLPRTMQGGSLSGGYVALIVIVVLVVLTGILILAFFLYRRKTRSCKKSTPYSLNTVQEKRRPRTWQRLSSGISEKKLLGEDTQSLISHHSRMPSITISRPIAHSVHSGPTPIFGSQPHRYTGISDFSESSQSSPEAVYDPYGRARSRSRTNSISNSIPSTTRSRTASPNIYTHSRDSSVSSRHSRSPSNSRSSQPLGQNSWSQARARSLSGSSSNKRILSQTSPPLPETHEEHIPSNKSSHRERSLPPPPPKLLTQQKPPVRAADLEGLQVDDTQMISIAIAAPLDMPEGPLTPFGEREAKAGAALGMKSTWYKSPRNDTGSWLV